jgi:hypothetical protein
MWGMGWIELAQDINVVGFLPAVYSIDT